MDNKKPDSEDAIRKGWDPHKARDEAWAKKSNVVKLPHQPKDGGLVMSSEIFVERYTPPESLLDGVLRRRFVYSLTANTGAGKTAVALLLSACVAMGRNFGNREVTKGRVLYLAGENDEDVRMRWIAMAEAMSFDASDVQVYFAPERFPISEKFDQLKKEIEPLGKFDLVVVDTSAAYFEGEDENDNVSMGRHARMLRQLRDLPGGPCVLIPCHPTKNARNDNLLPRGGGAFLAEVDGNLVCEKTDNLVDVHWQGKFRGPNFDPLNFEFVTITSENLKDSRGRQIYSVMAKELTEIKREEIRRESNKSIDEVLLLMSTAPGGSFASMCKTLGWVSADGTPKKSKIQRIFAKLLDKHLVMQDRHDQYHLTTRGEAEAKKCQ